MMMPSTVKALLLLLLSTFTITACALEVSYGELREPTGIRAQLQQRHVFYQKRNGGGKKQEDKTKIAWDQDVQREMIPALIKFLGAKTKDYYARLNTMAKEAKEFGFHSGWIDDEIKEVKDIKIELADAISLRQDELTPTAKVQLNQFKKLVEMVEKEAEGVKHTYDTTKVTVTY